MFLSGVLFPVFLAISLAVDEGGPMILPIVLFFVALVMMLYARLFSEEEISTIKGQPGQTSALGTMSEANVLPPASYVGMHGVGAQQVRTAELAQPPTVTEHTTKLLDSE